MAKVEGPLMSLNASGTVGGTITFGKNKGRNFVRTRTTPANPRSAGQVAVRANFAGLIALYHANLDTIVANYATLAKQGATTPLAAFTGYNQRRLSQLQPPQDTPGATPYSPGANATAFAGAVSGNSIQVEWTDSTDPDVWGYWIYRKVDSAPTGLKNELVGLVVPGILKFVDAPLMPATYYYGIVAFTNSGAAYGGIDTSTGLVVT